MAMRLGRHIAAAGGTYYAFPASGDLDDWTTARVQLVDSDGVGRYEASLDDSIDTDWLIFAGATAPASLDLADDMFSIFVLTADAVSDDVYDELAAVASIASVTVTPTLAYGLSRATGNTAALYNDETQTISVTVLNAEGDAVDLSSKTLAIFIETKDRVAVATVDDEDITVAGAGSNVVSFEAPSAVTASERQLSYSIRDVAAPKTVWAKGIIDVTYAPHAQAE